MASFSFHCRWPRWAQLLIATAALCVAGSVARADDTDSPGEALRQGEMVLQLRLRYENVADDAVGTKEAHASTLRTVLGYRTASYRGWSFYAEAENVTALGNDLYNNLGAGGSNNGVGDRPVVADPAMTELNQALVRYEAGDWALTAGRQEIALGDQRFVGPVGWRQNHQSFDAVRLDRGGDGPLEVSYLYLDRAHRIFDDSRDMSSHALWATWALRPEARLGAYGLLLDYRDPGAAGLSTSTLGLEVTGRHAFGDRALLYEAELAEQRDAADNPGSIDAGYRFLMVGSSFAGVTVKLGLEVLEGSVGNGSFRTPLATLHKFNGWADKFLATPPAGLEDLHLAVSGKAGKIGWQVRLHDFSAESAAADYGQEVDFQLLYTSPARVDFGLKGALYDAERLGSDTEKLMLWAAYKI